MRKKIALLLSIIMIVASMPISAFAGTSNVYGVFEGSDCYGTDETFNIDKSSKVIDFSTVTDLKVRFLYNRITCKDKTKLKTVDLTECYYDLSPLMFADFVNLNTVKFGHNNYIPYGILANTSVEDIVIPMDAESIDKRAFENMPKLKTIDNQSGTEYTLQIGGAKVVVAPYDTIVIGPRLEEAELIIDNTNPTFTYNLKPINFGDEEITFTMVENASNKLQVSADGVLSGTIVNNGELYDECVINAKSTSYDVNLAISINYADVDQKFNLTLDVTDEYTCLVKDGAIGEGVISRDKIYELEIEDKYGPISYLDLYAESEYGGESVPSYMYNNVLYIDTTYISPNRTNIILDMARGVYMDSAVHDGYMAKWATKIDSLPYSKTSVLEPSDSKLEFSAVSNAYFSDVYSYALPLGKAMKVTVSDTENLTPLIVNISLTKYDEANDEYIAINDEIYDFNKVNVTGEEVLFVNDYDVDTVVFISVCRLDNDGLFKPYKIDVEEYDYFKDVPPITVDTELYIDNTTPSVDSIEGKYSWNKDTKTLTLKDGFSYFYEPSGITVPADATVIVEGNAAILSDYEGITFDEETITQGTSKIILNKGSHLCILTNDEGIMYKSKELQVIGTPDENGKLPKITAYTEYNTINNSIKDPNCGPNGETTIESKLYLKNVDFYSLSDSENIEIKDSRIKIEGCNLVFDAYDEENIYTNRYDNKTIDDAGVGIEIIDSTLVLNSFTDENIESETGSINIKNSKLDCYAPNDDGIYCDNNGDINIENSVLNIVCDYEGIQSDEGSVTLADTKLSYKNVGEQDDDDYVIYAKKDIVAPNNVNLYDKDGKLVYSGRLDALVQSAGTKNGIVLKDSDGNVIVVSDTLPVSTKTTTLDDIKVEELKTSYENGEDIVVVGQIPTLTYEVGDERLRAVSWEILGTDKKGTYDEDAMAIKVPTKGLADGEYTAVVRFEKEVLAANGVWQKVKDADGNVVTQTKEIKFVVGQIPVPSESNVKSPETGADMDIVFGIALMLGVSLSVLAITKRKKVTNK